MNPRRTQFEQFNKQDNVYASQKYETVIVIQMTTEDLVYDVVICGAGIMGTFTALDCARRNKRVLIIEKENTYLHQKGSSWGPTRAWRMAYVLPHYAQMMKHSLQIWRELEQELNVQLLATTGGLDFSTNPNSECLDGVVRSCIACGERYESIQGAGAIEQRFSYFKFQDSQNAGAVYTENYGVVFAERALKSAMELARKKYGVKLMESTQISSGERTQSMWSLLLSNGMQISTQKLIICAGSSTNSVLAHVGSRSRAALEKRVMHVAHFELDVDSKELVTWAEYSNEGVECEYYGMPDLNSTKGAVMKVGNLYSNSNKTDFEAKKLFEQYISKRFSKINQKSLETLKVDTCLCTMTPEREFILSKVPDLEEVFVAAGFSCHGFKHSPFIGRFMYSLAFGDIPENWENLESKFPFVHAKTSSL